MTQTGPSTSATGGSADSQINTLDERAWQPRRGISRVIRLAAVVIPAAVSFGAVWAAMVVVPRPEPMLLVVAWLVMLIGVALAGTRAAGFATRRLTPLAALFRMSLVFPDAAPSRFHAALRSQSGRQLGRDAEAGFSTHQDAAEHLIDLLARLSAHDRLTRGHSERVRAYAVMLGEELDLGADALAKLNWAALAHDIGKLHVPESILNKNGRPTDDEWLVLKEHPAAAAMHIEALRPWLGDWVDCATQHHERYDGSGYPSGLAGNRISLSGRIVAIADAFDVMTATRSYKRPFPASQARAELLRNAGTQFDPSLVRSFLEISIPAPRWAFGWIGWLSHLPTLVRVPGTPAVPSLGGVVAAGTVAAATFIGAPLTEPGPPTIDVAAERNIDLDAPPTPADPGAESGPTTPPATVVAPTTSGPPTSTTVSSRPEATTTTGPAGTPTTAPTTPTPPTSTPPTSTNTTVTTSTSTTTTSTSTSTTTTTTTASPDSTEAVDDAQTVILLIGRTIAVLANDDFGSSTADLETLQVVAPPSKGDATVVGDTIEYTPDLFATGVDTFSYRICSMSGSCDSATVTVTIAL